MNRLHRSIDAIAAFCGSIPFLLINVGIYLVWMAINTFAPEWLRFDKFPYVLMITLLSIESLLLTCFVLISQNHQAERDHARAEADHKLNVIEEAQNAKILEILRELKERG